MKHCPSLTPAELAKKKAAYAARDCRAYSKRANALLDRVWQEYETKGEALAEEAENLLAAVDAAAESARDLLKAIGARRAVRDWDRKAARYAE